MIVALDNIVVDPKMRGLCAKPYEGHPRGCPNFGKKLGCPPQAPLWTDVYETRGFAIVNEFDLAAHVERMHIYHRDWSDRQLRCCLYWQGSARKRLEAAIVEFKREHRGYEVCRCPEACGVNVTETLRAAGVVLEWPPLRIARQVAIAAARVRR